VDSVRRRRLHRQAVRPPRYWRGSTHSPAPPAHALAACHRGAAREQSCLEENLRAARISSGHSAHEGLPPRPPRLAFRSATPWAATSAPSSSTTGRCFYISTSAGTASGVLTVSAQTRLPAAGLSAGGAGFALAERFPGRSFPRWTAVSFERFERYFTISYLVLETWGRSGMATPPTRSAAAPTARSASGGRGRSSVRVWARDLGQASSSRASASSVYRRYSEFRALVGGFSSGLVLPALRRPHRCPSGPPANESRPRYTSSGSEGAHDDVSLLAFELAGAG
jgi:hypothetical protein